MEKIYSKKDNYQIFSEGERIDHTVLGEGTVVRFEENVTAYNVWYHYVVVHFDQDKPDKVRRFLPYDLQEFLKK